MNKWILFAAIVTLAVFTLVPGCASYQPRSDEGGIVGSGTKIDCERQPKHPSCQHTTQ